MNSPLPEENSRRENPYIAAGAGERHVEAMRDAARLGALAGALSFPISIYVLLKLLAPQTVAGGIEVWLFLAAPFGWILGACAGLLLASLRGRGEPRNACITQGEAWRAGWGALCSTLVLGVLMMTLGSWFLILVIFFGVTAIDFLFRFLQ